MQIEARHAKEEDVSELEVTVPCATCGGSGFSPDAKGNCYEDVCDGCGGSPQRTFGLSELEKHLRGFSSPLTTDDAKELREIACAAVRALRLTTLKQGT